MKTSVRFIHIACVLMLVLSGRTAGQKNTHAEAEKLNGQVVELFNSGHYDEALPVAERVLAIYEKSLGAEDPTVATALYNLAAIYRAKGDYARAEPLYQRALAIREKALGTEHLLVANTLDGLAGIYKARGNYSRAELLYQRSLMIVEKTLAPDDPEVATSLDNMAQLLLTKGDYARAEPMLQRALTIREKKLGSGSPDLAYTLNSLAELYVAQKDYARAEPLYRRTLAILEKALGPEHPVVAASLNNLATLYKDKGDYAQAEPLSRRALVILEKVFGPNHTALTNPLNTLALISYYQGNYSQAELFQRRALALLEKTLGPEHPHVKASLTNLAALYEVQGDIPRAMQSLERALEISERNLNLNLFSDSEDQKQRYINSLNGETRMAISLNVRSAPTDVQAARLAMTTILRRKGRALDAMADQLAALRRRSSPQDRQLLDQLSSARSQLATLELSGSGVKPTPEERRAEIDRLRVAVEHLEDEVSRRSEEFRAQVQSVTIDDVSRALPVDAALVEIVAYRPFNPKVRKIDEGTDPAQYVAYVLKHDNTAPQFAELGPTAAIDAAVDQFRMALQNPNRSDVKVLSRKLDELVMKPIRRVLGPLRQIFLSPDGSLNLIPFGALVDERGQYLIENYLVCYLTSGRDLLRLQIARKSDAAPVLMADPLYDLAEGGAQQTSATHPPPSDPAKQPPQENRRSVDFTSLTYKMLPGTAEEVHSLRALLPDAQIMLGREANEAALKHLHAPRILHIATHGFFIPDQTPDVKATGNRQLLLDSGQAIPRQENPLLRSGLILAGVNQGRSGAGEDGVLTALEAAGLDLWGTRLVVLSACETGLGEVHNGAGVYGLRRALVLAGSETQVISLWQVSDTATRDLMVAFYNRLQSGEGRAEALRQVQLDMLNGKTAGRMGQSRGLGIEASSLPPASIRSHPYYWAAFIGSGAWTSLTDK